eukprot:m.79465 g.79465  ORF g.79465 m.79465 type:complete len:397 (-) comp14794_c1_seq3:56-1246(-)
MDHTHKKPKEDNDAAAAAADASAKHSHGDQHHHQHQHHHEHHHEHHQQQQQQHSAATLSAEQVTDAFALLSIQDKGWLQKDERERLEQHFGLATAPMMLALLPFIAARAHCNVSHFHVGVVVLGHSGRAYFGVNIEFRNVGINQAVHGEQCAISRAFSLGEDYLTDLFVNAAPCGHCRQFMAEMKGADELRIWFGGRQYALSDLLPSAFTPGDLGCTHPLFDRSDKRKVRHNALIPSDIVLASVELGDTRTAELSALASSSLASATALATATAASPSPHALPPDVAALLLTEFSRSYSPHTHSDAAVVVAMKTGELFGGAYLENAAYNPSLGPLQMAICRLLCDHPGDLLDTFCKDVAAVYLLQRAQAPLSLVDATRSVLNSFTTAVPLTISTVLA